MSFQLVVMQQHQLLCPSCWWSATPITMSFTAKILALAWLSQLQSTLTTIGGLKQPKLFTVFLLWSKLWLYNGGPRVLGKDVAMAVGSSVAMHGNLPATNYTLI